MVELKDMGDAMVLIALIVLIGAAAAISVEEFTSEIQEDLPTQSATIETQTIPTTNNSRIVLTFNNVEITAVNGIIYSNSTSNLTGAAGSQYTLSGGQVTWIDATVLGNLSYWNYTYRLASGSYNISTEGEIALQNSTDLMNVMGTIIGVAALIALLVAAFKF